MALRHGTPEEAGMSPDRVERIRRLAERWVADGTHPALVTLVARRGVIVLHEAFGLLRPGPDAPSLRTDSVFPISSGTKPITATAVMQLVEAGLVGLNRPVQEYIPELRGDGKQDVMVHHLLTHTSGMNEETMLPVVQTRVGAMPIPPPEPTEYPILHEFLHLRYDLPLWRPPGELMCYENMNYALLGEIVRRVSGQPYHEYVALHIFSPLGMADSYLVVPDDVLPRVVSRWPGTPHPNLATPGAHRRASPQGGVYSTARDMATFGQLFLEGGRAGDRQVLSAASVAEMSRDQLPGVGAYIGGVTAPDANWSYGWAVQGNGRWPYYSGSLASPRAIWHPGAGGFNMWVDPEYEIVGVYCSVVTRMHQNLRPAWSYDLFVNAVTAAVTDGL